MYSQSLKIDAAILDTGMLTWINSMHFMMINLAQILFLWNSPTKTNKIRQLPLYVAIQKLRF